MKKILYLILGCAGLGLGALGSVLPMVPTVPFLMLAAYCFARSSRRLHGWFTGTRLYRENLADLAAGRGMTKAAKIRIMATVTALMALGFGCMGAVTAGRIVLVAIWVIHLLVFTFGIPTLRNTEKEKTV